MTALTKERQIWDHKAGDAAYQIWNDRNEDKWREAADSCADYFHQELMPVWRTNSVFVDIGCGIGRLTHRLTRRREAPVIHGIDISRPMLDIARQDPRKNEKFSLCDGRNLDFLDASIDGVYSMLVFQHIPPVAFRGYLREISRVLKVGGMFCFQFVAGDGEKQLAYESGLADVSRWCNECNLIISRANNGFMFDNWVWLTGRKRG